MKLNDYIKICNAIAFLMHPMVEFVIHDIETNTIIYINGSLSQRKVGDQSLLDNNALNDINQIAYPKINFDGRLVKSISLILEKQWLLCINCDVSVFNKMHDVCSTILQKNIGLQPKFLFENDWQNKLHTSIHGYLQNNNLSFDLLSKSDKKVIVKYLFDLGAFNEKKAADYIAKILKLGRATIFKYQREWRKNASK